MGMAAILLVSNNSTVLRQKDLSLNTEAPLAKVQERP